MSKSIQKSSGHTNALINETSPYLLQHAHNPVNWNAWNDETLAKAKSENKLLIISIGYAACHWCHVMEHESFEDSTVAKLMNDHFIPIKVDREERPDVDDVYMTACQLVSGRGCGWPLNAFALPDGRPIWAGTYFPKDQWMDILNQFKNLQETDPTKLKESAEKITQGINSFEDTELIDVSNKEFSKETMTQIEKDFLSNIDFKDGGRVGSPKFPMPNNYEFLLKTHDQYNNPKALEAVTTTLDKMASGGIYDQIGGGFARYSVDGVWHVPHFEKMLYDNGQLVSLYAQAYKVTGNPRYKEVIEQTISFTKSELMSNEGGFYSSLDADSEGEEGKFYVWSKAEIDSVFNDDQKSTIFNDYYDVSKRGNWEHTNILKVAEKDIRKKHKISQVELNNILLEGAQKLMAIRSTRVRPGTDDKILTSWNSLMTKGLVDAYTALGNQEYLELALRNANFVSTKQMEEDGRLNRNYKEGNSTINAFLDDYATTIDAFLRLYEVTFDEQWIHKATLLTNYVIAHFEDPDGYFYYTSDVDAPLIARKKEMSDNVISASNSIMGRNLLKLGELTYNKDYIAKSKEMILRMIDKIAESGQPNFYSNWCQLYFEHLNAPYEIAILGKNAVNLSLEMQKTYHSDAIYLGGTTEGSLALLKDKLQEGEDKIYVCKNKVCKFPVSTVAEAIQLMD